MIENLRIWYQSTRKKVAYFMLALVFSYIFLAISLISGSSPSIILGALCLTLVVPFSMFAMLATDNSVFDSLQSKKWVVITVGLVITIYSSLSYIWASNEVNAIFGVSASNLPWSTLILTVVYFFKNVVLLCSLGACAFVFVYVNVWVWRVLVTNYRGAWNLVKDVVGGFLFIFGLGLLMGSSGVLTKQKEEFAKMVAINADFSARHRCIGDEFRHSQGVLFLPTGNVLVAYPQPSDTFGWTFIFDEVPCKK
ncbi:hypothetical protein ACUNB6_004658 [Vibrio alginolyticus]|nr:hypothetical protein FQ332_08665 [Vibrio diabolicus]